MNKGLDALRWNRRRIGDVMNRCVGARAGRPLLRFCCFGLALGCMRLPSVWGADLRRLVGADVAVCVELNQLESRSQALNKSRLLKRFRDGAVYRRWLGGDDFKQLDTGLKFIRGLTGKPAWQLVRELFGRQAILAVYRLDEKKPIGVLLTTLRNGEELDGLMDIISRMDPRQTQPMMYRGVSYQCRKKLRPEQAGTLQYYVRLGDQAAFSDDQRAIQRVIDLHQLGAVDDGPQSSLLQHTLYNSISSGLRDKSLLSVFVDLGNWKDGGHSENPVWKSVDAVFAGLRMTDSVVVECVAHLAHEPFADWSEFCRHSAGVPAFFALAPRSSLLVIAGRQSGRIVARAFESLASDYEKRDFQVVRSMVAGLLLQRDPFDDVLSAMGTNWGAYIAPDPDSVGWPVTVLAAVELLAADQEVDQLPPLSVALDNLLITGLRALSTISKKQGPDATIAAEVGDGTTLRWMRSRMGITPAYGVSPGRLVLGTDPQHVRRAVALEPLGTHGVWSRLQREFLAGCGQVVYLNIAGIRQLISSDGDRLAELMSVPVGDNAPQRRQRLLEALELLDVAFLGIRFRQETVRIVIGAAVGNWSTPQ